MPTRANALAVMAKAPIPGTVKTRLAPFLSIEEAAQLSRALLVDQLEHLRAISTADFYLVFSPSDARKMMRQLAPLSFELLPQTEGDLGARMKHAFATLFAKGYERIILIGGDLPPVPLAYFDEAFEFLNGPERRVVLGPSRDGGYYLVGLNLRLPEIFEAMTWSHNQVLSQTLAKIVSHGVEHHLLPSWHDVDTLEDLRGLQSTWDSTVSETSPNAALFLSRLKRV
jgi:uncharacterized protein